VNFKREPGACNPSYSGGRDQEDRGLKPVGEKKKKERKKEKSETLSLESI
jgi:hypothetical protein